MVMKIFFMDWASVNLIRGYEKCEIFARELIDNTKKGVITDDEPTTVSAGAG